MDGVTREMDQPNREIAQPNTEMGRVSLEMARANPELARANPELARPNREMDRVSLEMARANRELAQANAELARANREMARPNREMDGASLEISRARTGVFGASPVESEASTPHPSREGDFMGRWIQDGQKVRKTSGNQPAKTNYWLETECPSGLTSTRFPPRYDRTMTRSYRASMIQLAFPKLLI